MRDELRSDVEAHNLLNRVCLNEHVAEEAAVPGPQGPSSSSKNNFLFRTRRVHKSPANLNMAGKVST